ncbi:unnamed protein product [Didymodactylos carnosus]|uniref:LolA-like domain-containing protein n=1 Tax=Didymodactylos carnosus TaxID=1234261 RepID=A0A814HCU3_9BILA|nr:unnamed protein product [Didymodactylos carnosus]CAF1007380.1 unnamed protein product [Didymodactylos carnosus]CAF3591584.1 unnamed protein product [Didymodactylos carnosus]CAF3778567.1 unnamed protein product [Didymodactylos carnosus]
MHYINVLFLLLHVINGQQIDLNICPSGLITQPNDPKWPPIPTTFEIFSELTFVDQSLEISQTFTSNRDAVYVTIAGTQFQHYYDFRTNEYLAIGSFVLNNVSTPVCARYIITNQFTTSNVSRSVLKPSILLGYSSNNLLNNVFGARYRGETIIRGIPASIFESCFYVTDIQATVNAIYYFNNPEKFLASSHQPELLKVDVRSRTLSGEEQSYSYNIFRYVPYPNKNEQIQSLETPTGVYCPNRTNTKALPEHLPSRLSINAEISLPRLYNSSLLTTFELIDEQLQFVRLDVYINNVDFREIHDYSTGLSYRYLPQTQQCSVSEISESSGDATLVDQTHIRMKSVYEFFQLADNHTQFQYIGVRWCRDRVRCHVWIGQKQAENKQIEQYEWYWAMEFNGQQLSEMIPVKLLITVISTPSTVPNTQEINFYNYLSHPMTIVAIDSTLADCYRALGPTNGFNYAILRFTIDNVQKYPVHKNILYLKYTILMELAFDLQVRSVRLSNIVIDHENDKNDLYVTFTLLDNPPFYGPVEQLHVEQASLSIIKHLEMIINLNVLKFRTRYDQGREVVLRAKPNSLKTLIFYTFPAVNNTHYINQTVVVHNNYTQISVQIKDITVTRHTGDRIAALWTGFILLGVVITISIGILLVMVKERRANIKRLIFCKSNKTPKWDLGETARLWSAGQVMLPSLTNEASLRSVESLFP